MFTTTVSNPSSAPNCLFLADQGGISDKVIDTPSLVISSAAAQLSFSNNWDMESSDQDYDGCVLEVSINGGAFVDILAAGGSFVSNGYNATISTDAMNPIGGREAWGNSSGGYVPTVVNLGANVNGQTIKLRFRMGTDEALGSAGWRIDNVAVTDATCAGPVPPPERDGNLPPSVSKLGNISTRAFVGTEGAVVIAGFILGNDTGQTGVIIRGLGPSLAAFGVPSPLADPTLELHNGDGALIQSNNDWEDVPAQAAEISAAGLAPSDHKEAAMSVMLSPGQYTAVLAGVNLTSGTGLVEVYDTSAAGLPTPTPTPSGTPTPTPSATPTLRDANADAVGNANADTVRDANADSDANADGDTNPDGDTDADAGGACLPENFDGVSAPALPANWVATNPIAGNGIMFTTTVNNPSSAPNCLFLADQGGISDKVIDTPSLVISSATAQLSFSNNWDMESSDQDYDGCVLEVPRPTSMGALSSTFLSPLGGRFVSNGYNATISTDAMNPIGGREAWGNSSGGYVPTVVNLGANVNGQTIKLRFRMGTDEALGSVGWRIDNVAVTDATCAP